MEDTWIHAFLSHIVTQAAEQEKDPALLGKMVADVIMATVRQGDDIPVDADPAEVAASFLADHLKTPIEQ